MARGHPGTEKWVAGCLWGLMRRPVCQFTWPQVDLVRVQGSPRPQSMRAHRGEEAGVRGTQRV